jgi:O-antigen ligase
MNRIRFGNRNIQIIVAIAVLILGIAVAIFFLLIPLENLYVLQSGMTSTLTKLMGAYLAFLVVICGALKYINEVFKNKKVLWLLLYGMIALVSVLLSTNTGQSLKIVITLWLSIVLYFVLIMMIRDVKTLNLATLALLVGAVISILSPVVLGFGRASVTSGSIWERYGGLWGDQNEFAAILLVLIPISISLFFLAKTRFYKLLYAAISVIIFAGFILTYSRGGFLAFSFMIILAMFKIITGKNRARILAIAIPCIIVGLAVLYFTVADEFISRVETLRVLENRESVRTESSLNKRYYYYFELAPKLFVENPILGVGYRDFISHNIYKQVSHNTYLEVLTGTGLAGFIPFIAILFLTWKELRTLAMLVPKDEDVQYLKTYGSALELGFLAYLVAGCFISLDIDKMLWLCVSLSAVLLNITRILYVNGHGNYTKSQYPVYRRS